MVRNAFLLASVLGNCFLAYLIFKPADASTTRHRMTCEQARSDTENKKAVGEYAKANGSLLSKVHSLLANSDYQLRNMTMKDGKVTFVYVSPGFYPSSCGVHFPGIDGSIVRVDSDIVVDPKIIGVW